MLGIVRTRIIVSLCVFLFWNKHRLFFYAFDSVLSRAFHIAGFLRIEKTFGGDAVISRLIENKESFV